MAADLVGGQALVDGVMIRRGPRWSAAARRGDGTIAVTTRESTPAFAPLRSVPFLRGVGALVDSVSVGLAAMGWSRAETEQRTERASAGETLVVLSVVSAVVAVFVLVPLAAAHGWGVLTSWDVTEPLVEGLVRLALFVLYLAMLSRLPGVRTTLEYHGAEHMVVAGFEHGAARTVEATRQWDVRHPRCGTDLFLLIFVVSIVAFALVGQVPVGWLIASRILLIPVVVGVAYEILRAGGTVSNPWVARALSAPGLALQRFTTAEPDDRQIEVALVALDALVGSRSDTDIPLGVE